jgi:hypothetical protein
MKVTIAHQGMDRRKEIRERRKNDWILWSLCSIYPFGDNQSYPVREGKRDEI